MNVPSGSVVAPYPPGSETIATSFSGVPRSSSAVPTTTPVPGTRRAYWRRGWVGKP